MQDKVGVSHPFRCFTVGGILWFSNKKTQSYTVEHQTSLLGSAIRHWNNTQDPNDSLL